MRVGVISGSGTYDWPGLRDPVPRTVTTRYGQVPVTEGRIGEVEVVHLSRHDGGHARLSHQVAHRANLAALRETGIDALISLTVCGAADPALEPGSLIVFDDLYFPHNRLPDGTTCTWFDQPGEPGRGHWIFDRPFAEAVRQALIAAAASRDLACAPVGCYGHVDGPRFNTRSEIAALASHGVSAVSQTAGPEVVLAGEAEVPMALLGFVTDYANGVVDEPEPIEALLERMARSRTVFADVVAAALPLLAHAAGQGDLAPAGMVYRFES
jgi:5'-methylthioadenosine phosphorylase